MSVSCVTPLSENTGEKIYTRWRCHRPLCSPVSADGRSEGRIDGAHTALRSPGLHSGVCVCVCKWYINGHIHTQKCVCTHIPTLPLSHKQTLTMCAFPLCYTLHFDKFKYRLHTHIHIKLSAAVISWSDAEGCLSTQSLFWGFRVGRVESGWCWDTTHSM